MNAHKGTLGASPADGLVLTERFTMGEDGQSTTVYDKEIDLPIAHAPTIAPYGQEAH